MALPTNVLVATEREDKAVEDVGLGTATVHGVKSERSCQKLQHDGQRQVDDRGSGKDNLAVRLARAVSRGVGGNWRNSSPGCPIQPSPIRSDPFVFGGGPKT